MRTVSAALAAHLAQEVTTLALCWKLTRRDSAVLGFTDYAEDIILDSQTYQAATGFTPTAIAITAGFAVDNLDVEGILDSGAITEEDIAAGLYDFAELEIFLVNYTDFSQGRLLLKRGWLGEVTLRSGTFTAEVRGLTQGLTQHIGELFSPLCRANLGDTRCGVDLEEFTVTGAITSVITQRRFIDTGRTEDTGYFNYGTLIFTSGANDGLSIEVRESFRDGVIDLVLPMTYPLEIGDGYAITAGCDKRFRTCREKFTNVINFRGEPHLPGMDKILQTAATRTNW